MPQHTIPPHRSPWSWLFPARAARPSRPRRASYRPGLEVLEDRITPAFNLLVDAVGATTGVTVTTASGTTTFSASASGAHLNVADIQNALLTSNTVVVDSGADGSEAGDIAINADVNSPVSGGRSLTFLTGSGAGVVGNIAVNGGFNSFPAPSADSPFSLHFLALNDLALNGNLSVGGGVVTLRATNGAIRPSTSGVANGGSFLDVSAANGIGTDAIPLVGSSSFFQASTATGGVFAILGNTVLGFPDESGSPNAVQVTDSGDIHISGILSVVKPVQGPGNVTLATFIAPGFGFAVLVAAGVSVSSTGAGAAVSLRGDVVTIDAGASVTTGAGGTVSVTANTLTLDGTISTGSPTVGAVTLAAAPGRPLDLGGTGAGPRLSLTDAMLDRVTAGTLQIGDATAGDISISGPISPDNVSALSLVTAGSVLDATPTEQADLTASTLTITAAGGVGSAADGDLDLNVNQLSISTTNNAVFVAEDSSTALPLAQTGTGGFTLTGGTFVTPGGAFSPATPVTVASGAVLETQGSETIGSLTGTGAVLLTSGTLNTGGDNTSTQFDGTISGSGSLTKQGTGTFTLTGANPYSGPTTVSAGTLVVGGQQPSSPVQVEGGATLAGNGTVGGVTGMGTVSPGVAGVGTLSVAGATDLDGSLAIDISGTSSDLLAGTAAATSLDLTGTALALNVNASPPGTTYVIVSSATGGITGTFNGLVDGTVFTAGGTSFTIRYSPSAVTLTSSLPLLAVGAGRGGPARVRVVDVRTQEELHSFLAYAPPYRSGVRLAVGDVTGDGIADIVTAPRTGVARVKVFDGVTGQPWTELPGGFLPFSARMTFGATVAVGNFDDDAALEVAVMPGRGPAQVRVFDLAGGQVQPLAGPLGNLQAFAGRPLGVRLAAGDLDGDGSDEVLVSAGGQVRVFAAGSATPVLEFAPFASGKSRPLFVAAADLDGQPGAEIFVARGRGSQSAVRLFDSAATLGKTFVAFDGFRGGVRLGLIDRDGDGRKDAIVAGEGPQGGGMVRLFDALSLNRIDEFFAFGPGFKGAVFVGG